MLPKDKVIFGPQQVANRINENTQISTDFTLFHQAGSQVQQGNLLVVPIGNSFLYFEPIYLRANQASSLPELKKVILADQTQVVYTDTLQEAIDQLVGTSTAPPPHEPASGHDHSGRGRADHRPRDAGQPALHGRLPGARVGRPGDVRVGDEDGRAAPHAAAGADRHRLNAGHGVAVAARDRLSDSLARPERHEQDREQRPESDLRGRARVQAQVLRLVRPRFHRDD